MSVSGGISSYSILAISLSVTSSHGSLAGVVTVVAGVVDVVVAVGATGATGATGTTGATDGFVAGSPANAFIPAKRIAMIDLFISLLPSGIPLFAYPGI